MRSTVARARAARSGSRSSGTGRGRLRRSLSRPAMVRRSAALKVPKVRRTSGSRSVNSASARPPTQRVEQVPQRRRRGSAAARRRRRTPRPRRPWRPPPPRADSARCSRAATSSSRSASISSRTIRPCSRPCRSDRSTSSARVASQRCRSRIRAGRVVGQQPERAVDLVDPAAHRGGAVGVQPGHRAGQAGADPHHQGLDHPGQRGGVGLPDVAVALGPGQRRQRLHQVHDVGVQGRPLGQRGQQPVQCVRQLGQQAAFDRPGQLQQGAVARGSGRPGRWPPTRRWCPRPRPRPAARRTPAASATPRSRGRCPGSRCRSPAGAIQSSSSTRSRWNSWDRARSIGRRRSRSQCRGLRLAPDPQASGRSRIRSASSGTVGTRSFDRAQRLADHQVLGDEADRPLVAVAEHGPGGLGDLGQPGQRARPRRLASVSASRTASITWALETGRSRSRSARATLVSQRAMVWSGAVHRWWYQPGEVIPAPYPLALASRWCGPRHPGQRHLALGADRAGSPRRRSPAAAARSAPARARHRRPPRPASRPRLRARRGWSAACTPRAAARVGLGRAGEPAQLGHRLDQQRERRRAVQPGLDQVLPPALGVVVAGRRGQGAERVAAAGSVRVAAVG